MPHGSRDARQPRDVTDTDPQELAQAEAAQGIQPPLEGAFSPDTLDQAPPQIGQRRGAGDGGRAGQKVNVLRVPGQRPGKELARRREHRKHTKRLTARPNGPEELQRRAGRLGNALEVEQARVGVGALRKRGEKVRQHLQESPLALRRYGRRVAAARYLAQARRCIRGKPKAEAFKQAGVFIVMLNDARKLRRHVALLPRAATRKRPEQPLVNLSHRARRRIVIRKEPLGRAGAVFIAVAHREGHPAQPDRIVWQMLHRQFIHKLQPMLHLPQKQISGLEKRLFPSTQHPDRDESAERVQRRPRPHFGMIGPRHKLQKLDGEFDIPYPSPAVFHLPIHGALARAVLFRALLHGQNLLHRHRVERTRESELGKKPLQPLAQARRAGDGPRLDERLPLPGLTPRVVVAKELRN